MKTCKSTGTKAALSDRGAMLLGFFHVPARSPDLSTAFIGDPLHPLAASHAMLRSLLLAG